MKAWRIGSHDVVGVAKAETRAKARYLCWRAAKSAGYNVTFADIHCKREPQHDDWALWGNERPGVYTFNYVEGTKKQCAADWKAREVKP